MKKNKVVVFGGSGFIGSHVADHLSKAGYKVFIYDLKKSSYLQHDQEMVVGDILDQEKVDSTVKGAEAVYNFAALADLDEAINQPIKTINVKVSFIIFNTFKYTGCRLTHLSTSLFRNNSRISKKTFLNGSKKICHSSTRLS